MPIHKEPSALAGKTVRIATGEFAGSDYRVEDWWDRVADKSWMFCDGNPACLNYAMRSSIESPPLPIDNEVLYGKVGAYGHLVHISEIAGDAIAAAA